MLCRDRSSHPFIVSGRDSVAASTEMDADVLQRWTRMRGLVNEDRSTNNVCTCCGSGPVFASVYRKPNPLYASASEKRSDGHFITHFHRVGRIVKITDGLIGNDSQVFAYSCLTTDKAWFVKGSYLNSWLLHWLLSCMLWFNSSFS